MKVVLTKDVTENGAVKSTVRARRRTYQPWERGEVIDMSEASAAKYIADGRAQAYVDPAAPAAVEAAPTPLLAKGSK